MDVQTDTTTVNGRSSSSTYVAATRTLTATSSEGRSSEVVFDTQGRPSEVRRPAVATVTLSYDSHGRVTGVQQGCGLEQRSSTIEYDEDGFVETMTSPLLEEVHFERDPVGRVTKTTLPDGREVHYQYDLNGNLTRLTPPARPDHRFDHDAADRVEAYTPPDLDLETPEEPATTFAYNLDHQLTTVTRPDGQQVEIVYDSAGRPELVRSPFGDSTYVYDEESGRLESVATTSGASVAYHWDGPWLEEVTFDGPFEASVQLEADRPEPGQALTNFWLAKLTVNEQPSTEIELEYDDDGLPTRIGELDLFHDQTTGLMVGSHVLDTGTRVTRNDFGELTALEHGYHGPPYTSGGQPPFIGHVLLEVDYERDQIGRIVRKTEQRRTALGATPTTEVFEYEYEEGSGRLIEVERDDVVVESYAYDQNGNRTSWTRGVESGTATYDDQDRLLTYGPLSFTYTANGELRTRSQAGQTVTYTYDTFSNLRAVRLADGTQIEYLIDGSNRRIGKKINGTVVQRFLYLGGLSPIAELDAAGTVTTQYVYGTRINVPDYFVRGGTTYRILTDQLGSVRAVVDAATGAPAQRMEYDSFGRVTLDTNPGFQPFGFAGGLWDPQTGLVRFGARDYDPETGRWTTKDPIGFAGGDLNLYGYALGDPINAFDPSGRAGVTAESYEACQSIVTDTKVGVLRDAFETRTAGGIVTGIAVAYVFEAAGRFYCTAGHYPVLLQSRQGYEELIQVSAVGLRPSPKPKAAAARVSEGLDWSGTDPKGLTRREHVLRHGSDIPTRPEHGVFYVASHGEGTRGWPPIRDHLC